MFHPRLFSDVEDNDELNDLMWFTCFFGCITNPLHVHQAALIIGVLDIWYSFYLLFMIIIGRTYLFYAEFAFNFFIALLLVVGNKTNRPDFYKLWLYWKVIVLLTRVLCSTYLILTTAEVMTKIQIMEDYTRITTLKQVLDEKSANSFVLLPTLTIILIECHFWQIVYYAKNYLIDRFYMEMIKEKRALQYQSADNTQSYLVIKEEDEPEDTRSRVNSV
ncbi:unnamed protein product [Bursaphelenchus okinawaensis]|uniref:Uncharacterized protein n=1 Tax=Bursaphelenchus okinawaensis TaxID=465554 RepID=A0A811K2Q0_9BILA|nr:unnamed protein product [Bursaphelenchus okinawaensis]CAG9090444.1 unnamed protein product [Bursaphelenchus okinawaensis]